MEVQHALTKLANEPSSLFLFLLLPLTVLFNTTTICPSQFFSFPHSPYPGHHNTLSAKLFQVIFLQFQCKSSAQEPLYIIWILKRNTSSKSTPSSYPLQFNFHFLTYNNSVTSHFVHKIIIQTHFHCLLGPACLNTFCLSTFITY